MACALPRSWRSGGSSTDSRNNTRPTGANAQALHRLSGSTTRAAPVIPRRMRNAVQALGLERRVRTLGKVRETKNRESATESRKRARVDATSAGGISPGRIGGVELAFIGVWDFLMSESVNTNLLYLWDCKYRPGNRQLRACNVSRLVKECCNRVYSSLSGIRFA